MSPARRRKSSNNTILILVVILILGLFYVFTGSNPLKQLQSIPEIATAISGPIMETAIAVIPSIANTETPDVAPANPANGTWWTVYFVKPLRLNESQELEFRKKIPSQNYQGSVAGNLIQQIDKAQKTIHIASFETDLSDVANALIRAKDRGVDVRWITDDENGIMVDRQPGRGQFAMLKKAGIKVIDDERSGLMHNKFWIFDGQTVWTGSTNVTVSGMFEQDNNVVVIESPALAAVYERQWEDMWNGSFGPDSSSTVDQQSITIGKTPVTVLFAPEDNVISHILPYVQNAKSSVRFMAFAYTQEELGQAMLERFKKGIEVSGVFESTGSEEEFSQLKPLYCAKAPIRQDGNPNFLHHKVIIVDEQIVITGSFNFTENADTSNNENVIIIDNSEIAKRYTKEFQRVWEIAHVPESGSIKCR